MSTLAHIEVEEGQLSLLGQSTRPQMKPRPVAVPAGERIRLNGPALMVRFAGVLHDRLRNAADVWMTPDMIAAAVSGGNVAEPTSGEVFELLQELRVRPTYFRAFTHPQRTGTWYRFTRAHA